MAVTHRTDNVGAGLHGEFKVTPMTLTSGTRVTLPGTKLTGRKTVYVYNAGSSTQYLYIGDNSVSEFSATTSGLPLVGGSGFGIDAARSEIYGITDVSSLGIKVLEAA